ncbi:MAG: hypothetical protein WD872_20130 [Pirellulaceae bacterium]
MLPPTDSQRIAFVVLFAASAASLVVQDLAAQDYDDEPIRYSESTPDNPVSRLGEQMAAGTVVLEHQPPFSYLRSLLQALKVPESSQTLVYSKTSMQRQRITPRTPRALYFNDEVYVGFCKGGDVLEISVADPRLGAVFYTLERDDFAKPSLVRQGDKCLICHGSSQTKEIPGHLLRSVFVQPSGLPILSAGSYRIDQTSPFEQRWGGWYVTGTHGPQKHRGNLVVRGSSVPESVDNSAGMNVTDLGDRFMTSAYLSQHSDLVALMVLEHQTEAHNRIARASFQTRQALHYQQALNRELGESDDHVWDSTRSRIKSVGEPLVEYLLFSGEAELTHRIRGTSGFEEEFAKQGPRDGRGRSLRDFDLERRLFEYPCSYLVYSPSFQALPREAKDYVFERLWSILSGQDQTKPFAHLTAEDRRAILEILRETLPCLPDSWRAPPVGTES